MSQKPQTQDRYDSGSQENGALAAAGESRSDFWWNVVYFAILTIAIAFIIVNNDTTRLTSSTGLVILLVLVVLDAWPAVYLVRVLTAVIRNNLEEK
ncbi:MAG TPA: hypothetical protein VJ417_09790 [Candidatus Glassbacteria bacterium]|nr:hypothetical protein [Candidatus Glassbacteria bacterium]